MTFPQALVSSLENKVNLWHNKTPIGIGGISCERSLEDEPWLVLTEIPNPFNTGTHLDSARYLPNFFTPSETHCGDHYTSTLNIYFLQSCPSKLPSKFLSFCASLVLNIYFLFTYTKHLFFIVVVFL